MDNRRGERGQVLVLGALVMTAMLAFLALVIDVGYGVAQRRFMQNAADAASIAAARHLALSMQSGTTDGAVARVIARYVTANGEGSYTPDAPIGAVDGAWYVTPGGARIASVGATTSTTPIGAAPLGGFPTLLGEPVAGVEVVARKEFPTFFAKVLGVETMTASASATARFGQAASVLLTPPTGARVMPIVFDVQTYDQAIATCGGFNGYRITFARDITNPFTCNGNTGEGGFNWGPLVTGNNSNAIVKDLLDPDADMPGVSLSLGDPVQVSPGERAVDYRDLDGNWQGQDVIVPLVRDSVRAGCPNCTPPLAAFAWFHVYEAVGTGSPKTITGWWVNPATKPPMPGRQLADSTSNTGPLTFALVR